MVSSFTLVSSRFDPAPEDSIISTLLIMPASSVSRMEPWVSLVDVEALPLRGKSCSIEASMTEGESEGAIVMVADIGGMTEDEVVVEEEGCCCCCIEEAGRGGAENGR